MHCKRAGGWDATEMRPAELTVRLVRTSVLGPGTLGLCPLDGKPGPTDGALGRYSPRIAQAVTDSSRVLRESIRLRKVRRQLEPSILTQLHEQTKVVGERKLLAATGNGGLECLLHRLLCMEAHWRIRDPLLLVQGFRRNEILLRKREQIGG